MVTLVRRAGRPVGPPPVPDGASGFKNGSRVCSTRSGDDRRNVTPMSCGPPGIVRRSVMASPCEGLITFTRAPSSMTTMDGASPRPRLPPTATFSCVFTSDRKKMSNDRAAACAVRQRIDTDGLLRLGRNPIDGGRRSGRRRTNGRTTDHLGRRQVPFHQRRRHLQHAGDVVEAVTRIVRGQKVGSIHLYSQQVANGVDVLDAVQPMDGFRAARIRVCGGGSIQGSFECGAKGVGLPSHRVAGGRAAASARREASARLSPTSQRCRRGAQGSSPSSPRLPSLVLAL